MRTVASSLHGIVPMSGLSVFLLFAQSVLFAQLADFQVNDIRGSAITPHWNEPGVSLCVNDSGGFVITWTDGRDGNPDIYAQRYSRSGTALGSNFRVNDDVGSVSQHTPSISTDKGGNFVIAWAESFDDGANICAQHYSANGTPLGSNFQVNSIPGSLWCGNPCVSSSNTGGFVVSWDASGSIYAQRYSGDGRTLGSNFRVDDDTTFQRKSSVAMDRDGNFAVVWSKVDFPAFAIVCYSLPVFAIAKQNKKIMLPLHFFLRSLVMLL